MQSRCFTYVEDVVNAIVKLSEIPQAVGCVFNIGSDKEITILDLAKQVKALAKSESEIQFIPYDKAYQEGFEDMPRRVPDITRIRELIGYQPTKNIEDIIRTTLEFLQNSAHFPQPVAGK